MNVRIRIALVIVGIFAVSILSGCTNPTTSAHDTLVIQLEEEIITLDNRPYTQSSLYDSQVAYQYQGYLGMIAPGETIVTMPGIAESWTKEENNTKWTFTIREGLTFHDGTPIDAKAVRYSFYADWMVYNLYNNMSEAVDDLAMNITFPADDPNGNGRTVIISGDWFPDPMFEFDVCGDWNIFTLVPYGSHGGYNDTTTVCQEKIENFSESPISAGPYKFVEWKKEDYVLLERFDNWFGWGETITGSDGKKYTFPTVKQAFKYVKYRFIPEKAMALVELRTGGVDVTTGRFSSLNSLLEINKTDGYSAYMLPVLGGATMQTNIQGDWPSFYGGPGNFPVSQDWFRQAISHAINRTNIVENVYSGIADERDTIFSDWILDKFTNLDTTGYYDFDQGISKAEELLDNAGYTAMGFKDEPDNRFGWGLYANETEVNGVNQTKGRHFILTTMDCDFCVKRALAVQKDLRQIGIYVDTELLEWGQYLTALREGDSGWSYNTSYIEQGIPDPEFNGPHWDFTVGGFGGNYETPWDFIAYQTFLYWLYRGWGGYSWYSIDYEVGYAKATDGSGYLAYMPDDPGTRWDTPVWSNDNAQFIEGCQEAGYAMSHAMNKIPLVWYVDTYAFNSHLQNFVAGRNSMYLAAYAYWA
ncbi:MAG: ABC transporter substrate-binding protein [Candidatus Hodarchaeales archaeon]